jgi:hypothetical protein
MGVEAKLTPAAHIVPPEPVFFTDLNNELSDKGFLVTSAESDHLGAHWVAVVDDLWFGLLRR